MTATTIPVQRTVFATPRAAEFLELRALQAQTGQPVDAFGDVVVKELIDNALDAAETAGVDPVLTITTETVGDTVVVTVTDNGVGITPETITRICDFNNTVSDKARYRGPARGAQGNALKTLLGIPHALDVDAPVVIESHGVRHELQVMVDPVGDVVVNHDQAPILLPRGNGIAGTSVSVTLPKNVTVDISNWAFKAALVNPAATITAIDRANADDDGAPWIYKPTAERWSKWTPSQPSSPWWYNPEAFSALVYSHIRETARTGVDMPLGKFISEFDGLTGSAKQKQIRAVAPGITHLSGLQGRDDLIADLYLAMRQHSKPTTPARLGPVGKDHLEDVLDRGFGVRRSWYKQATVVAAGVPWVIEVMVANTDAPSGIWFGCNHAPSFGDPLGRTTLFAGDIYTTGAASFLSTAGVRRNFRAAVVHVICAATEFMDKGKVALVVPDEVASAAAEALSATTKVIRREDEQREKDAARAERAEQRAREDAARAERSDEWSLKDAVFKVLPEAKERAGTVVSARTLFYKVRPLMQQYTDRQFGKQGYQYFTQTLLPEYERTVGPIPGLYYEPRGELHHPHDGNVIRLGTREVEQYTLPPWQFDKILYVEKTGLQAQLAPYRLAEKYDMAIIYGQGYAATACRNLLASSAVRDLQIFVLHDADPAGYNIARTLAEATKRMPDHNIDVIDLGLTVPQAIEYELETEQFTRKRALPSDLDLDAKAREWFTGKFMRTARGKPQFDCTRCELNAFGSDELAAFIEDGLRRHGADTKLIPPQDVLASKAAGQRWAMLYNRIEDELRSMLDIRDLVQVLAPEVDLTGIDAAAIVEILEDEPTLSWDTAQARLVARAVESSGVNEGLRELVIDQIQNSGGEQ